MSFKLHYKGGPRDSRTEEAKSVHNTITCAEAQQAGFFGIYRLGKLKGNTASMIWVNQPKPAQRNIA